MLARDSSSVDPSSARNEPPRVPKRDESAAFARAVGDALREERQRQGLSQEAFGFEAELDRTYVSGVERGVRNPTLAIMLKWCQALGVRPSVILRRAEEAARWE
jgi:ribosome-binding protein aMBF1 (putative translation factor)